MCDDLDDLVTATDKEDEEMMKFDKQWKLTGLLSEEDIKKVCHQGHITSRCHQVWQEESFWSAKSLQPDMMVLPDENNYHV